MPPSYPPTLVFSCCSLYTDAPYLPTHTGFLLLQLIHRCPHPTHPHWFSPAAAYTQMPPSYPPTLVFSCCSLYTDAPFLPTHTGFLLLQLKHRCPLPTHPHWFSPAAAYTQMPPSYPPTLVFSCCSLYTDAPFLPTHTGFLLLQLKHRCPLPTHPHWFSPAAAYLVQKHKSSKVCGWFKAIIKKTLWLCCFHKAPEHEMKRQIGKVQ